MKKDLTIEEITTLKFGEVVIIPTVDFPDEQPLKAALNRLRGLGISEKRLEEWSNRKGIFLKAEDLRVISEYYTAKKNRPLVNIYAANSPMAALPPSRLGSAEPQGGQANYAQGWELGSHPERKPGKDGKLWINVSGIPTVTKAGGTTPPSGEELDHYISQLYFFIAQGKSISLPVRRFNWIAPGYRNENVSHIIDDHPTIIPNIYESVGPKRYKQVYEYSFGGGSTKGFGRELSFHLEQSLNDLTRLSKMLNKPDLTEVELNTIVNSIKNSAHQKAFKQGLEQNRANRLSESLDNEMTKELRAKYGVKIVEPEPEDLPIAKAEVKAESVEPVWTKINKEAFTQHFTNQGYTVKKASESEVHIILPSKKADGSLEGKVILKKKDDKHIQATVENPTPDSLKAMADAMHQALGLRGKVKIEVNSETPDDPNISKLKDDLWLEAMSKGLEVEGYVPKDVDLVTRGKSAQGKFLIENEKLDDEEESLIHKKR